MMPFSSLVIENDWKIKVGRFGSYDMFPLNRDTFVGIFGEYSERLYTVTVTAISI